LTWLANRVTHHVPLQWQHVLAWGGMRGALSLALALTVPLEFGAERERLRVMTLGVVLFTLLAQGATTGPLLRKLHIASRPRAHTDDGR
jgi:CPA1 family monovalent cation:H+ antiporter